MKSIDSSAISAPRRLFFPLAYVLPLVALASLWVWTQFCAAPWSPWNDVRLAPAIMAAHGVNPYADLGQGPVSTWLYGPVPLWAWWPATLAATAATAIVSVAALNAVYLIAAIVACVWLWPEKLSPLGRILAMATIVALWPAGTFEYVTADNVAIACALFANALLLRTTVAPRPGVSWLAAFLTAAAVGSKQTLVGVVLAQLIWFWLEHGFRPAAVHVLRVVTAGAALLTMMIAQFGLREPWHSMVELPRDFPWTVSPQERLLDFAPQIFLQLLIPALVISIYRRPLSRHGNPLRLACLTWLTCLPLDLAGILGTGGAPNSLHGFSLWVPSMALWALAELKWSFARQTLVASLTAAAVVSFFWTREAHRPLAPLTFHLNQASALCRDFPEQFWFPWNPTVTFYSDHKFYHAEDGLYARVTAGRKMTSAQLKEGLPAHLSFVALHGKSWGIALTLTDQKPLSSFDGTGWQIYSATEAR